MSRELDFDGYWQGDVVYSCDCFGCTKTVRFKFDGRDIDYTNQNRYLRSHGWIITEVNGQIKDFCNEDCRNKYINKITQGGRNEHSRLHPSRAQKRYPKKKA